MTDLLAPAADPDRLAAHTPSSLVLVAHRGPIRHADDGSGVQRNAGGLVTALESLVEEVDDEVRWICAPASDSDRVMARTEPWAEFETPTSTCRVRMLDIEPGAHNDFYNIVSNPLLWFVQHELYAEPPAFGERERRAWVDGYVAVNRAFARGLAGHDNVPFASTVMVHDYHFYLVPRMLRAARPDLFIQHFTHIPWPDPGAWRMLPPDVTGAIFRGLLGSDIVGFHTATHVRNFLVGCRDLFGLPIDLDDGSVEFEGRNVAVRHYPISINTDALETLAATPEVAERLDELERSRPEKLIVRVDRADPSKNIVRGFEAFAAMVRAHPELRGRVGFLALLQPTRGDVPEYIHYLQQIRDVTAAINAEWATADWLPIDLRLVEDLPLAIAAYKTFDVLLVNSVADGMNLVVKEGAIVNERDGVIVLSERAGAHDELGAVVVSVDPFDVTGQADALYEALVMPADVRDERLGIAAEIVRANDMRKWQRHQLNDIATARSI